MHGTKAAFFHSSAKSPCWEAMNHRSWRKDMEERSGVVLHIPRRQCRRFMVLFLAFVFTISAYLSLEALFRPGGKVHIHHEQQLQNGKLLGQSHSSWAKSENSWGTHQSNQKGKLDDQACVHKELQLWHPALKTYFTDPEPLRCSEVEENWVYTANGSFMISESAQLKHGNIMCEYIPLTRGSNDFQVIRGEPIRPLKHGSKLTSDFSDVRCVGADGSIYNNVHAGISISNNAQQRFKNRSLNKDSLNMNILMFGLDSTSRLTWMRNLPRTHDYFVSQLGAEVMEGYNIVGDGTPQALLPILTGKTETELPEARRGFENAKHVDGHPWIWKDLGRQGYVTQWGEDGAGVGTFTYRMLGFVNQPVDHYLRTFYLEAEGLYYKNKPYCLGSMPRHLNMLNWIRQLYEVYPDQPKFSFLFHSEYSHDKHSQARVADQDLKDFLWFMNEHGHLDNTLVILMADHGARFQSMRQTEQGKYEERLPYLAIRLPPAFLRKYPQIAKNLRNNAQRLTTPFDLHATFQDILNFTGADLHNHGQRGISLLKEIPKERTCKDANVEPHWCACLQWKKTDVQDSIVKKAADALVQTINQIIEDQSELCLRIVLHNITEAVKMTAGDDMLHFKQSLDIHGRNPDLSDDMKATEELYQVSITTNPGLAHFEGTVTHVVQHDQYLVSLKQISRTNKYGKQPQCIMDKLPHLRPYCFCKSQL